MADVDMTDAAAEVPKAKNVKPSKSGTADTPGDAKKRFEVKKVRHIPEYHQDQFLTWCSGMPSHSGHGISSSITVRSAEITSWICVSSVKPTKVLPQLKSVRSLGEYAITPFISTVYRGGSRRDKYARSTTGTGSSRSMVDDHRDATN